MRWAGASLTASDDGKYGGGFPVSTIQVGCPQLEKLIEIVIFRDNKCIKVLSLV